MKVNFYTNISTVKNQKSDKIKRREINPMISNDSDDKHSSYVNINFTAKPIKIIPSPVEIARRKALEAQAVIQRQSMQTILQMLFPLPVSSGIRAKHVQGINKQILSNEFLEQFPLFKKSVKEFIMGNSSNNLLEQEDNALNQIIYSNSEEENVIIDDMPYSLLLNKAFGNSEFFKNISLHDKALIISILKSFKTDGGELTKNIDTEYKNLIQYAKDIREKLTEPVEATLNDEEIENYFEQNKTATMIMLLTAGGHPSRQRLEQRLNKYDKSLKTINCLFKIPDLRENIVAICKNQNKVNPAEIIKFLELSKGMLDLGTSVPDLNTLIKNSLLKEGINVDYLSKEYLKKLLSNYNSNTDIDFSTWDLGHVYTIPYFLNNRSETHKEGLKNLILASVNNNYKELIHNPKLAYGQGNLITQYLFEKNGLDYNLWLNYDHEKFFTLLSKSEFLKTSANFPSDSRFPKANENFDIRVWKRNPAKDLFQGSTAGQCIALDGVNGYAGVDELMYSYAQLIEVVNKSKDKSIGNACTYWIKDLNGEIALLIDSIGIHTEYENNPQIRSEIFEFAKKYANDVSGKQTKVYIGNQFNKLDIQDLAKPIKGEFKIIGNTNGEKSYLDAIIAKDRFERYVAIDNNKNYLMELREIR